MPSHTLQKVLSLVTTCPDDIREEHLRKYGDTIGNTFDLSVLLRKPAIRLDEDSLAGLSGHLLVQRYTCGLYWDIHDSLPNEPHIRPNRQLFQTFFGELHERYGRSVLERITDLQTKAGKKASLACEADYMSDSGPNPDSMLIENVGSRNVRCALFEFKVGRPRYVQSLVHGDVEAFEEDMRRKIEVAIEQEIGLCQQILSREREIPCMPVQNVSKWFFVVVVADPFPSSSSFSGAFTGKGS